MSLILSLDLTMLWEFGKGKSKCYATEKLSGEKKVWLGLQRIRKLSVVSDFFELNKDFKVLFL